MVERFTVIRSAQVHAGSLPAPRARAPGSRRPFQANCLRAAPSHLLAAGAAFSFTLASYLDAAGGWLSRHRKCGLIQCS